MGFRPTGFADALSELRPDLVVLLGDRFEIFTAVAAALMKERIEHEKCSLCAGAPGHNGDRPINAVDVPIEGIVLGINEESAARLQESTGFAKDILTRVEEDVWNGI